MIAEKDTLAAVLFLKFIAAEKGERPDLSLAVRSIPGQPWKEHDQQETHVVKVKYLGAG